MLECNKCGFSCINNNTLLNHQKKARYCSKYEDILFVCLLCNFKTKGIKNIEEHKTSCSHTKDILNDITEKSEEKNVVEDEISNYIFKNSELESKLKNKDVIIMNLHLRLRYEQMKNNLYSSIIQTQTNINLEDIIKESENEVNIYNFINGNIPIIVHNFIKNSENNILQEGVDINSDLDINTQKYIIEPIVNKKKIVKKKKKKIIPEEENDLILEYDEGDIEEKEKDISIDIPKNIVQPKFRSVKEYIKTSEKELCTKLKEDVVRVEKEIEEIVYNNFDVSHKEIIDNIEELFVQIHNNRIYTANLFTMRELRRKLLGKINLEQYTSLVFSHVKRLEDIFSNKKYNKKKINKIIHTSLTPLDTRIIYYEGYTNVIMDIEDIHKFGLALGILVQHKKHFVPYDKKVFFNNIKNYGLSLFELQECIERCIVNMYGFNNIIYLDRCKSKVGDPYSFYSLNSVKDTRFWKMECRLEDFSIDFVDNVLPYCINLFKKIYKDIFTDNVYRSDYMSKSQIAEFDCEQLLQNIILLAKPNLLCKTFQKIIMNNCTFNSTETDKFNLYGDDKLQQKRLSVAVDTDEDVSKVFKQLFDGLSTEDSIKILRDKSIN